uniref:ATP synthase complex subunit 8 n=1 Tax=Raddaella batesii TaxID=1929907 RepID=A0A517U721_9TELE|nr:ATP synthase F0 subunit 8 [Raddaella batesii]QDT76460.1 ATP synthase F0 subunit 8 [Raddaella batesii]
MPQLNPAPWFAILFFAWMIFLIILPPKILAHKCPNDPGLRNLVVTETKFWNWPWQ